jgi:hypothetical protein
MMAWPHWQKGAEMIKKYIVRYETIISLRQTEVWKTEWGKIHVCGKLPHEGLNPSRGVETTQLHTAYRSATSRGSTLCSDILPFSTAYIRTTYPMRTRTSYTYIGVIRPDHEVKHPPHLLTTSRERETSPFTHESSLRDAEPQNLT